MIARSGPKAPPEPERTPEPPATTSREILRGGREITILHAGEAYRLRLTSNDKLILTK